MPPMMPPITRSTIFSTKDARRALSASSLSRSWLFALQEVSPEPPASSRLPLHPSIAKAKDNARSTCTRSCFPSRPSTARGLRPLPAGSVPRPPAPLSPARSTAVRPGVQPAPPIQYSRHWCSYAAPRMGEDEVPWTIAWAFSALAGEPLSGQDFRGFPRICRARADASNAGQEAGQDPPDADWLMQATTTSPKRACRCGGRRGPRGTCHGFPGPGAASPALRPSYRVPSCVTCPSATGPTRPTRLRQPQ
jgi:hypothetical protein